MAMSLEQLLAEEGFKGRRSKKTSSGPLYPHQSRHKVSASSGVRRTERAKSDIPQYDYNRSNRRSDRDSNLRQRALTKDKFLNQRLKSFSTESSEESPGSEITDVGLRNEIVEVVENEQRYKEIYSNEIYSHEESDENHSEKIIWGKTNRRPGRASFSDNRNKNHVQAESSNARSKRNSLNSKGFDDSRARRKAEKEQSIDTPALDEAAIKAIVLILSGHMKAFLKDEDFRTSLRHNSFASLNFFGLEEGLDVKSKIIDSLEEAIETVERAAEGNASPKEVKKSSLQLSVITGLNSNDLKDGFTSGIPNFKLAACAHLYLSVIYKMQKKDKISAKHILQVFCDSPFQARTSLLSDLWDQIFLPHLSHLKIWYVKQVGLLENADEKSSNLKLLEKAYNDALDVGTQNFAVYYKDWLTGGVEPPSIPSVEIPFISPIQHEDPKTTPHVFDSASCSFSVSKRLYDEVFRRSNDIGADAEEEICEGSASKSEGSVVEGTQAITHYSEPVENEDREIEPDDICQSPKMSATEETEKACSASHSEGNELVENFSNRHPNQSIPDNSIAPDVVPYPKESEIIIERIAKAFFQQQKMDESDSKDDHQHYDSVMDKELHRVQGNAEMQDSCDTEFICPLTGLVFEDPVTLETGQSFERAAISNWFSKGHRTCPIMAMKLECQVVPLSNFILKRVIDKWKLEHRNHLLAFSSQLTCDSKAETAIPILEKLLVVSSKDERTNLVKRLISLGGLQFLIHRFNSGNLDEKTRVSALLSSCIETDSDCRNVVARNIDKSCLLEILCIDKLEAVRKAISLMTELICLNRRKDAKVFLSGFRREDIESITHRLLSYIKSTREQKSLVATLLLHFLLLIDTQSSSTCIDEAVDAITSDLESSFMNEKPREMCCKSLLILGGRFSTSGKIMTEDWILKYAGFLDRFESDLENTEDNEPVDGGMTMTDDDDEEEEVVREEWLVNLSASLLGRGKKSFPGAISMCLGSGNKELVRVCLTTVAWLSSVMASHSDIELELSAFSALVSQLKGCLEHGDLLEHKVLASVCLLNFSKLPDCRVLLTMIGEAIGDNLECLSEVTWAARELHAVISRSS